MNKIFLTIALLALPSTAAANCIITRITNLHPDRKDWIAVAEDMKPTLEPGDCMVGKLDFIAAEITAGAIIVFRHPTSGEDWIKRVGAVGGQTVQMVGGELIVDGTPVNRNEVAPYLQRMDYEGASYPRCHRLTREGETCEIKQYEEALGTVAYRTLDLGSFSMDFATEVRVPDNHVFAMGDNRDNSLDSRTPVEAGGVGFVPVSAIIGILIYP